MATAPWVRGVIDLHTHILPGIDDGAADVVLSIAMADIAAADGVRTLVATPHVRADHPRVVPAEMAGRVAELNESLRRYTIDLTVVPGGEVALSAGLDLDEEALRAVTLNQNGQDLLIETPHGGLPPDFEDLVTAVRGRGFRVTLAHPELSPDFQAAPDRLGRMAEDGVLVQLTASSLLGSKRSAARALAVRAVEEEWVHVVASDAHAPRWREPRLGSFIAQLRRAQPGWAAVLDWATDAAPRAVLDGAPLPPRPARETRRLRLWR